MLPVAILALPDDTLFLVAAPFVALPTPFVSGPLLSPLYDADEVAPLPLASARPL